MKNWRDLLVSKTESIKHVMSLFEKNGAPIVIVTDEYDILQGSVTDGDIRRGMLRNVNAENSVENVMNANPVTVTYDTPKEEIMLKFNALDIRYLPIIDDNKHVIGVYCKSDLGESFGKNNPIVIMAGGEGLRLRPFTEKLPKPLVDINGTPIIEKLLINLINQGFQNFFLSINYLGDLIESYFGDGRKWGVSIHYLREDKKLGTAGSLKLLGKVDNDVIILNGDLVTNVNFKRILEYHVAEKASGTIGIQRVALRVPYGVVNYNDTDVFSLEEKPSFSYNINCGIYVLSQKVIEMIAEGECIDMTSLMNLLLNKKEKVIAFPIYEEWHDIANIQDLERVRERLAYNA